MRPYLPTLFMPTRRQVHMAAPIPAAERTTKWRIARSHPCLQRAHADPAIRERLATLLSLDPINRQVGLKSYLATHLQCPPADVHEVMASIRYDPVAVKLLALMQDQSDMPPVPSR